MYDVLLLGRGNGVMARQDHPGNVFFQCLVWDIIITREEYNHTMGMEDDNYDDDSKRIPQMAHSILKVIAALGGRVVEQYQANQCSSSSRNRPTLPQHAQSCSPTNNNNNNNKTADQKDQNNQRCSKEEEEDDDDLLLQYYYVVVSKERALETACQAIRLERKHTNPPKGYQEYVLKRDQAPSPPRSDGTKTQRTAVHTVKTKKEKKFAKNNPPGETRMIPSSTATAFNRKTVAPPMFVEEDEDDDNNDNDNHDEAEDKAHHSQNKKAKNETFTNGGFPLLHTRPISSLAGEDWFQLGGTSGITTQQRTTKRVHRSSHSHWPVEDRPDIWLEQHRYDDYDGDAKPLNSVGAAVARETPVDGVTKNKQGGNRAPPPQQQQHQQHFHKSQQLLWPRSVVPKGGSPEKTTNRYKNKARIVVVPRPPAAAVLRDAPLREISAQSNNVDSLSFASVLSPMKNKQKYSPMEEPNYRGSSTPLSEERKATKQITSFQDKNQKQGASLPSTPRKSLIAIAPRPANTPATTPGCYTTTASTDSFSPSIMTRPCNKKLVQLQPCPLPPPPPMPSSGLGVLAAVAAGFEHRIDEAAAAAAGASPAAAAAPSVLVSIAVTATEDAGGSYSSRGTKC
ncbi:hypothetical protein ACA910_013967 [Epithemia clementina (nom. ined.)]